MKATSSPGFKAAIGGPWESNAGIPPQIDAILDSGDFVGIDWTEQSGKLYININGVTILRISGIKRGQLTLENEPILL